MKRNLLVYLLMIVPIFINAQNLKNVRLDKAMGYRNIKLGSKPKEYSNLICKPEIGIDDCHFEFDSNFVIGNAKLLAIKPQFYNGKMYRFELKYELEDSSEIIKEFTNLFGERIKIPNNRYLSYWEGEKVYLQMSFGTILFSLKIKENIWHKAWFKDFYSTIPVGNIRKLNKKAGPTGVKLGMKLKNLEVDTTISQQYNTEKGEYVDKMMYKNTNPNSLENPRHWYRRKNENLKLGEIELEGIYFGFIDKKLFTIRGEFPKNYRIKYYLDSLFVSKYGIPKHGRWSKRSEHFENPLDDNEWVGCKVKLLVKENHFEISLKNLERRIETREKVFFNNRWYEFWKKKSDIKYGPPIYE